MARIKVFDTITQSWVYADKSFGKTPEKGVDYYTKDDKTELVNEITSNIIENNDFIELDTALTQSGKAADAKAVGDALAKKQPLGDYALKSEIPTDYLKSIPAEYVTESELNAKGYLTAYTETDPTVPSWAKQPNKPTYTASEVGALPNTTQIPTKVSELTNDSGFIDNSKFSKVVNSTATVINIKEKYGIDDTGNTDCSTLINQAINDISMGKWDSNKGITLYLPSGNYKLDSSIIVNKSINIQFDGIMNYTGSEFAFIFSMFNHCTAKFNIIKASNGSCIKLFSEWDNEKHYIQYNHFIFNALIAKPKSDVDIGGYCILAEPVNGGWINENRFTGGKIESGGYGVYADCNGNNAFNGNLFDSCGIEGVGVGFYLANNCKNNMIYRCRHSESFEKFLNTVGVCYGLKVISNSPFRVGENVISNDTTGFVIASLVSGNDKLCDTKGNFVRGAIVCEKHDNTKYLASEPSGIFDMTNLLDYEEEYVNFVSSGNCTGIKLNKKYGYCGGINEFFVKFANANTSIFSISDCDGNPLTYNIPQSANSVVKFNWFEETGWQYSYEYSNAEQVKELIQLSDYARNSEVVKTVNNVYPDENGNIEITVIEEDPIVVGSIEECVDTTKKYVLPDGYIYAYKRRFYKGETTPNFKNQLPISKSPNMDDSIYNGCGYKYNINLIPNTDKNAFTEAASANQGTYSVYTTGLIPVKKGDIVRINRITGHSHQGQTDAFFKVYRKNVQHYATFYYQNNQLAPIINGGGKYTIETSGYNHVLTDIEIPLDNNTLSWVANDELGWFVCCFTTATNPDDVIITVNQEITYTVTEDRYEWSWENTGKVYDQVDYLGMINDLDERIDNLESSAGGSYNSENWTFTLEDGSTVTKAVCVR